MAGEILIQCGSPSFELVITLLAYVDWRFRVDSGATMCVLAPVDSVLLKALRTRSVAGVSVDAIKLPGLQCIG